MKKKSFVSFTDKFYYLPKILTLLYQTLLVVLTVAYSATPAYAGLAYDVNFNDPSETYSAYYDDIRSNVLAAGSAWDTYIVENTNARIEVQIDFSSTIPTATGASFASSFVRNDGDFTIWEQGAAHEINTGIDPNGAIPDIRFELGSSYLTNELWFDPDPSNRTDPVANGRTDAVSVFLHEFGHAFAINGWKNPSDGSLSDIFLSTFDEHVFFDGTDLFFQGPQATTVYGGDVPLTMENYTHVGNFSPRPGSDLIPDLMNGVSFVEGSRYFISELDVAILADSGVHVIPIPAAFWLLGTSLIGLIGMKKRVPSFS